MFQKNVKQSNNYTLKKQLKKKLNKLYAQTSQTKGELSVWFERLKQFKQRNNIQLKNNIKDMVNKAEKNLKNSVKNEVNKVCKSKQFNLAKHTTNQPLPKQ